jgi:DNA processing protein
MDKDTFYLFWFASCFNFGPRRLMSLFEGFGSFERAFLASSLELRASGVDGKVLEQWVEHKRNFDAEKEMEKILNLGVSLLDFRDDGYPEMLKQCHDFPPLLYYRGEMLPRDALCISVVGSRKSTSYGNLAIDLIGKPLVDHGVILVSGLAFGIDGLVHKLCVNNRSKTVAVLGSGVDDRSIYPREHFNLAMEILENGGLIISEYPPNTPSLKQNFVARNRIIAGLSVGTLVVEAAGHSGSLITAQQAIDFDRTVYAVPGPISSEMSEGPNNLLKIGARPVTKASDILQDLNIEDAGELQAKRLVDFTMMEQKILEHLSFEPKAIDAIIQDSMIEPGIATATLTFLEIKGAVRHLGGQVYVIAVKIV